MKIESIQVHKYNKYYHLFYNIVPGFNELSSAASRVEVIWGKRNVLKRIEELMKKLV
jgi:hypothetical protein